MESNELSNSSHDFQRIGNYSAVPMKFEENLPFSRLVPHRITKTYFDTHSNVPLHYANTFELNLFNNVQGVFFIDNHQIDLSRHRVVVVPPNHIHGSQVPKCGGDHRCLKISFTQLNHYLQIENILLYNQIHLESIPYCYDNYDAFDAVLNELTDSDDNIISRMICLLKIFDLLAQNATAGPHILHENDVSQNELKKLIQWTQENCSSKLSLDDAASVVGFSKNYFCKWFKSHTNISYINYVNQVRIFQACGMLSKGECVSDVSYKCGYESISYFIQVFKSVMGTTPKKYISLHRSGAGTDLTGPGADCDT